MITVDQMLGSNSIGNWLSDEEENRKMITQHPRFLKKNYILCPFIIYLNKFFVHDTAVIKAQISTNIMPPHLSQ